MKLLKVFTNDNRYMLAYTDELRAKVERGESIYMCTVADSIEKRGIEEGKLISLISLVSKGLLAKEVAANELGMTVEAFEQEMKRKAL